MLGTKAERPSLAAVHPEYLKVRFRGGCDDNWPPSFVIITAFATTGEVWSQEKNREADARMKAILDHRAVWHRRLTGYSPETGHAEPGWAAELSLDEGLDLGRRFLQDAIYHVVGDGLTVVLCRLEGAGQEEGQVRRVEMGSFRERLTPAGGSSDPGRTQDLPPAPGG
ncbi:MAG: DUF3293 domain-containing protein [Gemmatimonadota bacterium]